MKKIRHNWQTLSNSQICAKCGVQREVGYLGNWFYCWHWISFEIASRITKTYCLQEIK